MNEWTFGEAGKMAFHLTILTAELGLVSLKSRCLSGLVPNRWSESNPPRVGLKSTSQQQSTLSPPPTSEFTKSNRVGSLLLAKALYSFVLVAVSWSFSRNLRKGSDTRAFLSQQKHLLNITWDVSTLVTETFLYSSLYVSDLTSYFFFFCFLLITSVGFLTGFRVQKV